MILNIFILDNCLVTFTLLMEHHFLFLFELGMSFGFIEEIKDAIKNYRASKKDPVAAAAEVASTSGSIACVTQAKAFQDVSLL